MAQTKVVSEATQLERALEVDADSINNAQRELEVERTMPLKQLVRLYPKAMLWSIIISLPVIMSGYDLALIGNFYAYPQFAKKFGHPLPDGTYSISAPWQSALTNGVVVGEVLGLTVNGWACERFGFKLVTQAALILLTVLIFIPFFAPSVEVLLVGQILCGIPWGVFQTLTIAYAADVCPAGLRAYLTSYVTLCWIAGNLIATGVLRGLLSRADQWAYRIPFALQWMWPVPIFCIVLFAPESPYWLIRKGRISDARNSLTRLISVTDEKLDAVLALMLHTTRMEEESTAGTSYWDCFKGTNLRRTEIVCVYGGIVQVMCGQALSGLSIYFFIQAGFNTTHAFDLGLGQVGVLLVGFLIGWVNLRYFGRRTLALIGLSILCLLLFVVGFLSLAPPKNAGASWAAGVMLVLWSFVAGTTYYPTVFPIQAEIPSTRLRSKTIVLQRNLYCVVGLVMNILNLYMLNPTAWNLQRRIAFIYASTCFCCVVYVYFRVPEGRGLTYADLNDLFEKKVDARHFKASAADPLHQDRHETKQVEK